VRKNKPSPNNFPGTDWQLLDELELSVGSSMDDKIDINVWLTEILSPLELHIDFFHRVSSSAQDAIARAMHIVARTELAHVHLLIFATKENTSKGKSWGFFRIEKGETSTAHKNRYNNLIEFYLYVEE
jgi:hypothetical protein